MNCILSTILKIMYCPAEPIMNRIVCSVNSLLQSLYSAAMFEISKVQNLEQQSEVKIVEPKYLLQYMHQSSTLQYDIRHKSATYNSQNILKLQTIVLYRPQSTTLQYDISYQSLNILKQQTIVLYRPYKSLVQYPTCNIAENTDY